MRRFLYIILAVFFSLLASCGGGNGGGTSQRPVLYNIAIDIADLELDTRWPPYMAFGQERDSGDLNATFEYRPAEGSNIISPVDGTIVELEFDPNPGDYSIGIEATGASDWLIILDHVQNPTIELGDTVTHGQVLGVAGIWDPGLGRTELQIFNDLDRLSYCPTAFLSPDVKDGIEDELIDLMERWNAFTTDPTERYDINEMNPAGCLAETVQG